MESWLATLTGGEGKRLRSAWQSMIAAAAKGKAENEINGNLIATRPQQNQQALGVLLGESGEANTYGADGQRSSGSGRRTLGSA